MNGVNLSLYVQDLSFLKNLGEDNFYDKIVLFGVDQFAISDFGENIVFVDVELENKNLFDIFEDLQEKYTTPLLILGQASVKNLPGNFNFGQWTILNSWAGFSGISKKISPVVEDLNLVLKQKISVYEPCDLAGMIEILKIKGAKYIRLNSLETVGKLLADKEFEKSGVINLVDAGLSGLNMTVIGIGNVLGNLIHAHHILADQGLTVDLFGVQDYDFALTPELHKSLSTTEKLVVVYDQKRGSDYEKTLTKKLKNIENLKIGFLVPEYENLTTVMDYLDLEQLKFDPYGLAELLSGVI